MAKNEVFVRNFDKFLLTTTPISIEGGGGL